MPASPREDALAIWRAGLGAAAVAPLVARALGSLTLDPPRTGRVLVLGCGKASAAMAQAVEAALGDRVSDGFVVVKDGHVAPTRRIGVSEAGHPVPDARGERAAGRLLELAASAREDDLVVVLISGGGSALTPAPAPPVTLEEKQSLTRMLLASGATINELNAVRKHLSRFKGGLLARAAAPAAVVALVLSDVIGDPLDVIASGPTAPDPTTFDDAIEVLRRRHAWDRVAASIRGRLEAGAAGRLEETPKPDDPVFARVTNVVIGNNALVIDGAAAAAEGLGYRVHVWTSALEGEARTVAGDLLARARRLEPPACLLAGGETTVTVRGRGRGGRCQELALAAALALGRGEDLVALAAGTDGTDGPTDAAGAVVDAATPARARAAGVEPGAALEANDAYRCLEASGDLVVTGPTNTNLLDLYMILKPGAR